MKDIKLKTQQIIIEKLGLRESEITDKADFYNDLGVDSLDFFELMNSIEKSFNIIIEEDFHGKIKTVGSLVQLVEVKVKADAAPRVEYAH